MTLLCSCEGFIFIFQIKEWRSDLGYFLISLFFWFVWIRLLLIAMYPDLECFSQLPLILGLFVLFLFFGLVILVLLESLLQEAFQEI